MSLYRLHNNTSTEVVFEAWVLLMVPGGICKQYFITEFLHFILCSYMDIGEPGEPLLAQNSV